MLATHFFNQQLNKIFLLNIMDEILMDHVIELLEKKKFKKKLVKKLNENVDLPFFDERVEKKVINSFYETLVKALKEIDL
jgi:hypothetical protein